MLAFKRAEDAFAGEAQKAGFETEEDMQEYMKEIRKEVRGRWFADNAGYQHLYFHDILSFCTDQRTGKKINRKPSDSSLWLCDRRTTACNGT